jgi:ubiquinone/menaquinone biosynthesis C-methylase UbiE
MLDDRLLFAGTAWYYARYRPGYPAEFFERVIERFGLDGRGRLLDLGCGTGQIILTLSGLVERAVGMDPDQDMLSEAKLAARHAGADNVT